MKKHLLLAAMGLTFAACNPIAYQVIETKPVQSTSATGNSFENKDLLITYDFWKGTENIDFTVFNKTANPIFLDLNRSHLIVNGLSLDYYQNTETTTAVKAATSTYAYGSTTHQQAEKRVSSRMKEVVQIPPLSFIRVTGDAITPGRVIDCDMPRVKSKPVSKTYTPEASPLKFRNYLTYSATQDFSAPQVIDNGFYASNITAVLESDFLGGETIIKTCPNDQHGVLSDKMPYLKPSNIYVKYKR